MHPDCFGLVVCRVVDVGGGEGAAGVKAVSIVVNGFLRAGDLPAYQLGIAPYANLEAAIACANGALFGHASVVAVDAAFTRTDAAACAACASNRNAQADAFIALLAVVVTAALQTFYVQVAACAGLHLGAAYGCKADKHQRNYSLTQSSRQRK